MDGGLLARPGASHRIGRALARHAIVLAGGAVVVVGAIGRDRT